MKGNDNSEEEREELDDDDDHNGDRSFSERLVSQLRASSALEGQLGPSCAILEPS